MPAADALPLLVTDGAQARAAMGTKVRIRGTAHNAKLAAVVVSDGLSVYCIELEEWPDEFLRQAVEVTGTISRTDQYKARVDEDGAISQGTAGGDWIMKGCSFVAAED